MSPAIEKIHLSRKSRKRFQLKAAILVSVPLLLLYTFFSTNNKNEQYSITGSPINRFYAGPFLAGNDQCRIPDIDPYDETILQYIKPADPIVCSDHDPLTYTILQDGHQELRISKDVLTRHYNRSLDSLDCCYSVITRVDENRNNESKCFQFESSARLNGDVEFIYVKCFEKNSNTELYKNMHAVVQLKTPLNHASLRGAHAPGDEDRNTGGIQERRPNVLLLGIDSISRLNLKRTMPRTVSYLRDNSWIELRKYNKVGDNTIPNLMAILTGLNEQQLIKIKCWYNSSKHFDPCPFVWNDFKMKGYMTAYVEDEPIISTFNYAEKSGGFLHPPTEYYTRPFIVEAMKRLPLHVRDTHAICIGPTSTTDHFLKYTTDLLATFSNSLFALIWLNNFSHENFNTPAAVDERYLQFLQNSSTSGAFNNTIVIFFSDHGPRFNDIRLTYVGWLEERLPFIYIWVPDWFKQKYAEAYRNLVNNGDRLTSPYDVHLLLKDVVRGSVGVASSGSPGCPTCVSLLQSVPVNRSCMDAGITEHWCTCAKQTQTSVTGIVVRNGTQFVIGEIGQKLSQKKNSTSESKCAKLKLSKIISARTKEDSIKAVEYIDYVIVFETVPGLAVFDTTVRYWSNNTTSPYQIIGMISRINSYAKQSECVHDKELKLYCFCKNILD